jgi:hypothetical protein
MGGEPVEPVYMIKRVHEPLCAKSCEISDSSYIVFLLFGCLTVTDIAKSTAQNDVKREQTNCLEQFHWFIFCFYDIPFLDQGLDTVIVGGHVRFKNAIVEGRGE